MTLVARLVWRFDYPLAYDYIDKRGAALRILMTKFPEYFQKASEAQDDGITVEHLQPNVERMVISVDRTNINGALVFYEGRDFDRILGAEMFEKANALVSDLLKLSGVSNLNRAGFRLIFACHNKHITKDNEEIYVQSDSLDCVRKSFGKMEDSAVILVGKGADGTSYRHQTGPIRRLNIDQALEAPTSDAIWEKFSSYGSICDIDLFDLDFTFTSSLYRWAVPKVQKVDGWLTAVSGD